MEKLKRNQNNSNIINKNCRLPTRKFFDEFL